jgi:hypothetical protein
MHRVNFDAVEAISAESANLRTNVWISSIVSARQVTPGIQRWGIGEGAIAVAPTIDGTLTRPKPAESWRKMRAS